MGIHYNVGTRLLLSITRSIFGICIIIAMTNLRRTYFDLRRSVRLKRLRIKLLAVMLMVPFTQIVIATMDTLLQFGLIKYDNHLDPLVRGVRIQSLIVGTFMVAFSVLSSVAFRSSEFELRDSLVRHSDKDNDRHCLLWFNLCDFGEANRQVYGYEDARAEFDAHKRAAARFGFFKGDESISDINNDIFEFSRHPD